ncbi:fluoride efflux transporter CrcB [Amycolatopsis sp. FDAARGOS 1241]|uniref:fluoride efflux transporter CrcB n=1 Tax=Amycolatopsis sp. FDAARGOS 1241 TaxID=2778070 RepID=UPI0019513D29|nr:fluoride efflux transporter CrcB [Amycolatopsis sp. FDAARGOS 1241]QRP49144.1 fluoride efflux transporter CrcB [Amycolatopsis sp. FDAARGOS 1241]
MTVLLVIAGAIVGAPLRYLTDRFVQARHGSPFPWGTFVVNLTGCLILGGLAGAGSALPTAVSLLAGTGFCGALTTYSTFGYETVRLLERRAYWPAVGNIALSVVAGVGAAALGYAVVHALVG